jgi:hypothetical protein
MFMFNWFYWNGNWGRYQHLSILCCVFKGQTSFQSNCCNYVYIGCVKIYLNKLIFKNIFTGSVAGAGASNTRATRRSARLQKNQPPEESNAPQSLENLRGDLKVLNHSLDRPQPHRHPLRGSLNNDFYILLLCLQLISDVCLQKYSVHHF